jgi:hypothetical protein
VNIKRKAFSLAILLAFGSLLMAGGNNSALAGGAKRSKLEGTWVVNYTATGTCTGDGRGCEIIIRGERSLTRLRPPLCSRVTRI